ncbi:DUF397 domain-containing protein [Spirillospora sp. NBC_00431]
MIAKDELTWRKSSHSPDTDQCVELARLSGAVGVRDSKDQNGPILRIDRPDLVVLLDAARRGTLDL